MTLKELAASYRMSAAALRERITELRGLPEGSQEATKQRIKTLEAMWRDDRDIAVFLEKYYVRGYHKNGKYTV